MALKVLIIEDNFIIQMFLEDIISGMGHDIVGTADNGDAAINIIKAKNPNLVLLDIGLSGNLNGIELAKIIKDEFGTPFVFLTGNSDKVTLEKAQRTNPIHIINKPFDEDKLKMEFAIILEILEGRQ